MINRSSLFRALGIPTFSQKKASEVTFSARGPGNFSVGSWMVGDEACYSEVKNHTPLQMKPKVILAPGMHAKFELEMDANFYSRKDKPFVAFSPELEVLSALLDYCEVYTAYESMLVARPVLSIEELLQALKVQKRVSKDLIEQSITSQNVAITDFIILDDEAYTNIQQELVDYPDNIDPYSLVIDLNHSSTPAFFQQCLPSTCANAQTLHLKGNGVELHTLLMPKLNITHLFLENCMIPPQLLVQFEQLRELTFMNFNSNSIDALLEVASKMRITKLKLVNSFPTKKCTVTLSHLKAFECDISEMLFSEGFSINKLLPPGLQSFSISSDMEPGDSTMFNLGLGSFPNLEFFEYDTDYSSDNEPECLNEFLAVLPPSLVSMSLSLTLPEGALLNLDSCNLPNLSYLTLSTRDLNGFKPLLTKVAKKLARLCLDFRCCEDESYHMFKDPLYSSIPDLSDITFPNLQDLRFDVGHPENDMPSIITAMMQTSEVLTRKICTLFNPNIRSLELVYPVWEVADTLDFMHLEKLHIMGTPDSIRAFSLPSSQSCLQDLQLDFIDCSDDCDDEWSSDEEKTRPFHLDLANAPGLRSLRVVGETYKNESPPLELTLENAPYDTLESIDLSALWDFSYVLKAFSKVTRFSMEHNSIPQFRGSFFPALKFVDNRGDRSLRAYRDTGAESGVEAQTIRTKSYIKALDVTGMDGNTEPDTCSYKADTTLTAVEIFGINGTRILTHTDYRVNILNRVSWQNHRLEFLSTTQEESDWVLCVFPDADKAVISDYASMREMQQLLVNQSSNALASAELNVRKMVREANKFVVLPMVHSGDRLVSFYCDRQDILELWSNIDTGQYAITLKSDAPVPEDGNLDILYTFSLATTDYSSIAIYQHSIHLPLDLKNALAKIISTTPSLNFIHDDTMLVEQKIEHLITLANAFKLEALSALPTDLLELLKLLLTEQKGVCRHRSFFAMILGHYLQVPIRIIANELHALIEIPHNLVNKTIGWEKVCLGGGPVVDNTPVSDPIPLFALTKSTAITSLESVSELVRIHLEEPRDEYPEFVTLLQTELTKSTAITSLESVSELVRIHSEKPLLVRLTGSQSAFEFHEQLLQVVKEDIAAKHVIYVDSASDLKKWFQCYYLEDNRRKIKDGPLKELILTSSWCILIVNWDGFTDTEKGIYKTLMDSEPTLLGYVVPRTLRVIGVSSAIASGNKAFLSRVQQCHVQCFKITREKIKRSVVSACIDLFEDEVNWYSALFGDINFQEDGLTLSEGPLLLAIKNKYGLTIINPPQNRDFKLLMHRLQTERRVLYNGEYIDVDSGFTVTIEQRALATKAQNIQIYTDEHFEMGMRTPIFISSHTWYQLFSTYAVNPEAKSLVNATNLLTHYDSNEHYFCISDAISEAQWAQLCEVTTSYYPGKKFEFYLLAGAEINTVATVDSVGNTGCGPEYPVILTNDTDLYTEQLAEKSEVHVIDISQHTAFNELLCTITVENREDGSAAFHYTEHELLNLLHDGKTVILTGTINSALYHQILPLLFKAPFYCNGQLWRPSGSLILVTETLPGQPHFIKYYHSHFYELVNYLESISAEMADTVANFHSFLSLLPHVGQNCPRQLRFNWRRIQTLLTPGGFESGFLTDYALGSEERAFVSMAFKICFQAFDTERDSRQLEALLEQHRIINSISVAPHVWKLMDCLNLEDYAQVFDKFDGTYLNSGFPTVSPECCEGIWDRINAIMIGDAAKPEITSLAILAAAIENPNNRLIFIKGEPGVAKTYTMRQLAKTSEMRIYEKVLDWLTSAEVGLKLLYIDEANTQAPGFWDYLKGCFRADGRIYYSGTFYTLTPEHRIIVSGNEEKTIGRFYHSLFQDYAHTVYFPMPGPAWLLEHIVSPKLQLQGIDAHNGEALLRAFYLIKDFNPYISLSIRDLENLVCRFVLYQSQKKEPAFNMYQALRVEFANSIKKPDVREQYLAALVQHMAEHFKTLERGALDSVVESCHEVYDGVYLPDSQRLVFEAIRDMLSLRKAQLPIMYKKGLLLEGSPGLGKSTLPLKALQAEGLTQATRETEFSAESHQHYIIINPGEVDIELLTTAFHQGWVVIADELNLDPGLEAILGQFLTGSDMQGKPADHPGFLVFASQNPGTAAGTKTLSRPMMNRFHHVYMDDYSDNALLLCAQAILGKTSTHDIASSAKMLVNNFIATRKINPDLSMRHFFHHCQAIATKMFEAPGNSKKRPASPVIGEPAAKRPRSLESVLHHSIFATVKGKRHSDQATDELSANRL